MKLTFIDELLTQLALWLALLLAALVLTGCANLGQMLLPETDPAILAANDAASRSKLSVDRFLAVQKVTPDEENLQAAALARSLDGKGFRNDLDTLNGQLRVYKKTRSPDARNAVMVATERVRAAGDVASKELSGQQLNRNRGDQFAPPLPNVDAHSLSVNVADIRELLIAWKAERDARVLAIRASTPPVLPAIITVTNTITVTNVIYLPATNAPPTTNAAAIPPKL